MQRTLSMIVLSMVCLCCGDNLRANPSTISGLTTRVVVRYDAEDVPHVRCAVARDCYAVQGYVQARDRFLAMDILRHAARARLAELVGLPGLAQDIQIRTVFTTRAGHRIEDDLAANLDAATRGVLQAFAAGVNAYLAELRTRGTSPPGGYAQLPFPIVMTDIEDWTITDTLAIGRLSQFQLSETLTKETAFAQFAAVFGPGGAHQDLAKLAAWVRAAAPATERAHTLSPGPGAPLGALESAPAWPALAPWAGALAAASRDVQALPADVSIGSNNWAISAAKSASGEAMIANDPHLPLQAPPLFHLIAMTSDLASDVLDVAGGSFPGIPGLLLGRGKHVGWGVTVTGYDVTDLYLEQFLAQADCPDGVLGTPCVRFQGRAVSTIPVRQVFRVRVGAGAAGLVNAKTLGLPNPPPDAVIVVPHHGPVVKAPDATGRALSVRWTGHETTQDTKALLALAVASDVDSAVGALQDFAVGAQNFVMADDHGHIAYSAHALVPVRHFAEGPRARPPWLPLPGDGTAEWGEDGVDCVGAAAAVLPLTCWIADSLLPHAKDPAKGYLFTANADPTFPSVSDDNNPLAHPPYLSFAWDDSSGFRATRIEQRIEADLAAHGRVSLADMQTLQADHVSRLAQAFAPYIARVETDGPDVVNLATGKAILEAWAARGWDCPSGLAGTGPGGTLDQRLGAVDDAAACMLFHEFIRVLYGAVFADDLQLANQPVAALAATKAMLHMLTLPDGSAGQSFCNDVDSTGRVIATHACIDQVKAAIARAVGALTAELGPKPSGWIWGRVHVTKIASPIAGAAVPVRQRSRPGGLFTVDVGNPLVSGSASDFGFTAGANVRHISVMSPSVPIMRMQLPGSERADGGQALGPDLLEQWAQNVYFDMPVGAQIDGRMVSTQIFQGGL